MHDHAIQCIHDPMLVALSYLVAVLGSYTALQLAIGIPAARNQRDRTQAVLASGAAMGGAIWAMHFIAMLACQMDVQVTYDLALTVLSAVIAMVSCMVGLGVAGSGVFAWSKLGLGGLFMGLGVAGMHYTGMAAMRMAATVHYDSSVVAISVVIAVVASCAALWLAFNMRGAALMLGSALVMGVAVCGMHYTGMAAAEFVDGAFCFSGNQLPAAMLPVPTTVGALLILGFGIAFTLMDARELSLARRAERERDVRVQTLAFVDRETGLPNRARLSQLIVDRIRTRTADGFSLITLRVEGSDGSAPTPGVMTSLLERIQRNLPGAVVARTQPEHLVVMVDGRVDDVTKRSSPLIEQFAREFAADGRYRFTTNSAHCPSDGNNAQWLLLRAAPKSTMAEHFAPPVAPAQERSQRRA